MFKMVEVAANLKVIREKIIQASAKRLPEFSSFEPALVAVSKIKPAEAVLEAYAAGQRHFGENYVNELVEKSSNPKILEQCKDIRWHFIGHLQRNKVNKVLGVTNLYLVETVDSEKLASALDNAWPKFRNSSDSKLKIMVQVNTSKENEKNGCEVEEAPSLVKHVLENCKNLEFMGLMTIGQYGYDVLKGPNPDFLSLIECRKNVCHELGLDMKNVELSMGMSSDFEHAIELGSSSVRVGSSIFGERPTKT
ncbi:pyridoxal phosphate homeostasis protein [Belonocnema kinseyi]|uniref:pyridoxal phosphate homeostasis protein n=1 Tax=Belonocnema kinseyi TaxID=2817044 RepID=UPI00143CE4D0|nr:pyridoxal phosphate homeostasis protein [Belonocnema kinseyi]